MILEYKPGASNQADGLSRHEDHDDGSNPENVTSGTRAPQSQLQTRNPKTT